MTTYDYYSISLRMGILILVLSCAAITNMIVHLSGVMEVNTFKCVVALWCFVGCIGIDISKNGIRQWRRKVRQFKCQPQSSLLKSEGEFGALASVIDPRAHVDC